MKSLLLHWHLGLGDAIICNGLVRNLAPNYSHIHLPCYNHNRWSVHDMFDDLDNVSTIVVRSDDEMDELLVGDECLGLGYYSDEPFDDRRFDQQFYRQAGVDFDKRWTDFKWGGDVGLSYTPDNSAFIHDDRSRGFKINMKLVNNKSLVRATNCKSVGVAIMALKNVAEIHCIDSCFALLADSLDTIATRKVIHRYARPGSTYPTYRNNWEIIT